MKYSDHELVQKSIMGNFDAFAELVNKYSNLVFAVVLSRMSDRHQAEDIAQEVFVKAWRKLSLIEDGEKFSSWLITIAKNQCFDFLRKKSRVKEEIMINEVASAYEHPSEAVDLLWDSIDSLNEKDRDLIVMKYISGYKTKEISGFLQLSESAVESRLKRAKEKLKKEMFDDMVAAFEGTRVSKEFEENVMWRIVPRIATIEIPVSDIEHSVTWYKKVLGVKAAHQDAQSAMLHLQGGSRIGVPTLYLVQTSDSNRLTFKNSNTNIQHSIIDFFIQDLERFHSFLQQEGVKVTDLNYFPGSKKGGFGFEDPDGNLLSACNVTHDGQE